MGRYLYWEYAISKNGRWEVYSVQYSSTWWIDNRIAWISADGMTQVSIDPFRSAIFYAACFLIVLLVGGLWVFRSMSKAEIRISAGIAAGIYLIMVLAQLYIPNFPPSLSMPLAYIQNWTGTLSSFLMELTDNATISAILSSFAPLLFIPFGRKPDT